MTARVIPFPLVRRVGLIRRQTAFLSGVSGQEGRLRAMLAQQAEALLAKGVSAGRVVAECEALERALLAALGPGSRAGGAR